MDRERVSTRDYYHLSHPCSGGHVHKRPHAHLVLTIVLRGQKGKGIGGQFQLATLDSGCELVAQVSGLRRGEPQCQFDPCRDFPTGVGIDAVVVNGR